MAKLKGAHGTCLSNAEDILKKGIEASSTGRAGGGFYLWSYISDKDNAASLAEDWYRDRLDFGSYKKCAKKDLVVLFYEIDVDDLSWLNINSIGHREALRKLATRARDKVDNSKVYDGYFAQISARRAELTKGVGLQIVETVVPVPHTTKKEKPGSNPLTVGAEAYIVLPAGLSKLKLIEARGLD